MTGWPGTTASTRSAHISWKLPTKSRAVPAAPQADRPAGWPTEGRGAWAGGWQGWSCWCGLAGVALAPGVQGVVDEAAALQQPLVVGFGVQAALADGQQPRAERVSVEVAGDVGGVDDPCQPHQGRVAAKVESVDEDLEGAAVVLVGELGAGRVERPRTVPLSDGEDLAGGHVGDLGGGVDEPADQPGAGDPVGLGTSAGRGGTAATGPGRRRSWRPRRPGTAAPAQPAAAAPPGPARPGGPGSGRCWWPPPRRSAHPVGPAPSHTPAGRVRQSATARCAPAAAQPRPAGSAPAARPPAAGWTAGG